jgi:hypothetical protein
LLLVIGDLRNERGYETSSYRFRLYQIRPRKQPKFIYCELRPKPHRQCIAREYTIYRYNYILSDHSNNKC